MNDLHERLEISCARCGKKGKPTVSLGYGPGVYISPPPDWGLVRANIDDKEGRAVCSECYDVMRHKLSQFWCNQ